MCCTHRHTHKTTYNRNATGLSRFLLLSRAFQKKIYKWRDKGKQRAHSPTHTHTQTYSHRTRVVSSINKSAFINNEACSKCNNSHTKEHTYVCVCVNVFKNVCMCVFKCVELSALYQFWHFKLLYCCCGCAFNLKPATPPPPPPLLFSDGSTRRSVQTRYVN